MKKMLNYRAIISMILALVLCVSLPITIWAETITINNPDGTVTVRDTSDPVIEGTDGDISVTVTITENTSGTRSDGSEYESTVNRTETTTFDDYTPTSGSWTEDGSSKTTVTEAPSDLTVDVPLQAGESDSDSTELPEKNPDEVVDGNTTTTTTVTPGSVTVTTTDVTITAGASDETDMDYTTTDTTTSADNDLFTTGEYLIATDENGNKIKVNGQYVYVLDEDGNKVPVYYGVPDPTDIPEESIPEITEGFEYGLIGTGNSSQFYAAILFKTPGYEGEEPNYIAPDGTKYYTHRERLKPTSVFGVEGVYIDGEKVDDGSAGAIWGNVAQYMMIDGETGELITTYCADMNTYAQDGYSYNMVNVEDANYYTEEQAAMIRTIANNGYWGVADDPDTPELEKGSLDAMRQMMADAKDENGEAVFTEDEIAMLTDGIAMTATQYSIWSFSNAMDDMEFVNCQWIKKDEENIGKGWSYAHLNNIPTDKLDSVALIFKLYNHMTNMEPTVTTNTTRDTIFSADTFVDNVNLTVVDKVAAADHENNRDEDKSNDAYYTNLTFALVVAPAERTADEPQDSLLVSLVDSHGNILAKGRIAGELQEGETLLLPDENGNYSFNNVVMVEGDQKFNLTLTGVQHLDEGVYLYSSEIRPETEGEDNDGDGLKGSDDVNGSASQTMVGVAGGAHGLNLSMEITFNVNIEDEVTVVERHWHDEDSFDYPPETPNDPPETPNDPPETPNDPPEDPEDPPRTPNDPPTPRNTPPEDEEFIPEEDVPLGGGDDDEIEILDEEVPLAEVPETGDTSTLFMMLAIFSVIGLVAVNFPRKKVFNF